MSELDAQPASDAEVLFPERVATIADTQVTMREYTFAECVRYGAEITALTRAFKGTAQGSVLFDLDALRAAFAASWGEVVKLMAVACDQPAPWVLGLSAADGYQLQMLWWSVNGPFFALRLAESMAWEQAVSDRMTSAGSTSSLN